MELGDKSVRTSAADIWRSVVLRHGDRPSPSNGASPLGEATASLTHRDAGRVVGSSV